MAADPVDPLVELIQLHVQRYPEMGILDVYKLLHQGVFGTGHSVPNRKTAREWLDQEAGLIRSEAGSTATRTLHSALIEPVRPDGALIRLHLRPYLAAGGELPALLDTYVKSADMVFGSAADMAERWQIFAQMIAPDGVLTSRFEARSVSLVGRTHAAQDWPSSPHTPAYIYFYKPVYRILTRDHAETLLRHQAISGG